MKQKLVTIIIVNWNGLHHLKKCLPSLYKQNYKKIEIILVDNASTDESVVWTKKNFSKIKIIKNSKNLGFAQGNNVGYKIASGEYILFLNNDTKVSKNFLKELLKVLSSDPKIGGAQSKILFMDSPSQLDSAGSYMTYTGFLYHLGIYQNPKNFKKQFEIFSAKGACMIFKKKVIDKILIDGNIFDSRFFAYFEETDFCHRVWLSGYKIVFAPKSIIYHKFGATSILLAKPFIEYHSYKNRINSYIKNLSLKNLLIILPIHILACEFLSLIFILRNKFHVFLAIQKAFFWNIINLPKTIAIRFYIQNKIRKVEDHIFFHKIMHNPEFDYYLSAVKGWNITQITKKNEK
ncbi:MAG: glycosyltransferase family 2 protein [Candidatus Woesebacteria bacterium]|nr:MAG: glycosyltransferase family 2 protein [Candidatus Woesebacteria bacterium]